MANHQHCILVDSLNHEIHPNSISEHLFPEGMPQTWLCFIQWACVPKIPRSTFKSSSCLKDLPDQCKQFTLPLLIYAIDMNNNISNIITAKLCKTFNWAKLILINLIKFSELSKFYYVKFSSGNSLYTRMIRISQP